MAIAHTEPDPAPLREWIDGALVPMGQSSENGDAALLGPPNPPPDDSDCADVVIYSSESSFISPVLSQVVGQGLKARCFVGSKNPDDARAGLAEVINANQNYEDECRMDPYWREYCTDYPISPGPLLIIVGTRQVVWHEAVSTSDRMCNPYPCESDFDIADVDGDFIPDAPITRIPADSLVQVQRACIAATDFNEGDYVDYPPHLMITIGDCTSDSPERCGGWPVGLAEEVASAYEGIGFRPRPILYASDYLPFYPEEPEVEAGRQQVNAGVREMWGVDTWVTGPYRWPGQFLCGPEYDAGMLATKQRFIAWLPQGSTS